MASTCTLFVFLFSVLGANAFFLRDDPLIDKVKAIVTKMDSYVSSQGYDVVDLPNVGVRTDKLVELTNGKFGVLSSLNFQSANSVNETKQDDGSILYTFDINVDFKQLIIRYDFDVKVIFVKEKGNFTLSVQKNSARVIGSVVVKDNSCEGKLASASITTFKDYNLTISPDNIPGIKVVTQAILDLATPTLLPSLNKAMASGLNQSDVQDIFSSVACSVLASLGTSPPYWEDPIVEIIKEVIYEADQFIAQEHKDELQLPDLGFHVWMGSVDLRNGRLGNFSTIQLRGTPNVTFEDNPDGSMTFKLYLPLGLDHAGIIYDFNIDVGDIVSKAGNSSIWTKDNIADVNVTFSIGGTQKCSAELNEFVLKEFRNLQINVMPEDMPEIAGVGEVILNFLAPRLVPIINTVVKEVIATDYFRQKFSELVCSQFPHQFKH